MKTLGLIGGMSWESTATYYKLLNEGTKARLGGLHSARLLLWSFDFARIAALQAAGDWDALTAEMINAASNLHRGGAEAIIICTNTMHKCAPAIEAATGLPLLHIADATGTAMQAQGVRRPALLATRYTMEQEFYKGRLEAGFAMQPLTPDDTGRTEVHRIIYDELCRGIVLPASKAAMLREVDKLRAQGADGVILGCTEIGMLLAQADTDLPVFDTTLLHTAAALDYALG